ncbi:MAG TPA: cellulase family glycosylhydrolase [Terriglobales bacterium]|nr:cellulase family glycosylhydrolase [Terriglobales bacterium]
MAPFYAIAWLLLTLLLAACGDDDSPAAVPAASATQWQRVELLFDQPVNDPNPFDRDGQNVQLELRTPGGATRVVDAFATRDYQRSLVGGFEKRTPVTQEMQWRARFAPTETGIWQWRWRWQDGGSEHLGEWSRLEVGAALPQDHGFLRISPRDPRYLELDDGSAYFPIGENMSWYNGEGTYAYDRWIARLAEQGGNYIRLWMPSWAFGLEWTTRDGSGALTSANLGNYDARLDRAWQLDYVIELARRHGIYVMLAIHYHGAFSLTSNVEWADNPYNAANGGPLVQPRELFTDPEAKELVQRRLRYIVARWGYATNILAWELWNEVDLADQPALSELKAWHSEMAQELDRLDPYDHLITTSASQGDALNPGSPFGEIWAVEEIDFSQVHFYAFGGAASDFTQVFPRTINRLRRYDKAILIAEAGVDFRGPAETIESDPEGDGFHDLLWAAPFAGAFGSGMTWWWDNVIDPLDLYFHFGPLAELVEGVDFPGENLVLQNKVLTAPDRRALKVFVLRGETTVLAWIKNAGHLWHSPDAEPVAGASLVIDGLAGGEWQGFWLDTRSGERVELITQAGASLAIPTFAKDIALRLNVAALARVRSAP